MKSTLSFLALTAGAAAQGFREAKPFSNPANIDNKCTPDLSPGLDFNDLDTGSFSNYRGLSFSGFTCSSGAATKSRFVRSGGGSGGFGSSGRGGNRISGTCGRAKDDSPSFAASGGDNGVDKFSVGSLYVAPEFDCDLEFHYDMPNGSTCKHRNFCSRGGTQVDNTQCGGAHNVTIVYPEQPEKPKPTCSIDIETISFNCNSASSTVSISTTSSSTAVSDIGSGIATITLTRASETLPTATLTNSSSSNTGSIPSVTQSLTIPIETKPAKTYPATMVPGNQTRPTVTLDTPTVPVEAKPVRETTLSETQAVSSSSSSGATVPLVTAPTYSPTVPQAPTGRSNNSLPVMSSATTSSPETTPASPIEAIEYPELVPQCLNSFMYLVQCKDNTDAACYCANDGLVRAVFDCFYAHGSSDALVAQAVQFLQGLCAPQLPENPAIAIGATCTNYIAVPVTVPVTLSPTATATIPAQVSATAPVVVTPGTPAVSYSTVAVTATTRVPCIDANGSVIPSSFTESLVKATLAVPQLAFYTSSAGAIEIIPATMTTTNDQTVATNGAGEAPPAPLQSAPADGNINSPGYGYAAPTGTTKVIRPQPTGGFATVNGAARRGAGAVGMGFIAAVAATVLLL